MDKNDSTIPRSKFLRPFEYQPLVESNQIRLLEVERCDDLDAPLHGKLHHEKLHDDDRVSYIALSYVWGASSTGEDLMIGGCQMRIQKNLSTALRYFRSTSSNKYIWADAVCINQHDADEKSSQIPLMSEIYSEALQVRVWFGDKVQDIALMTSIRALLRKVLIRDVPKSFSTELMSLLYHLLRLPWFSRRWVVQELVVNPMVSLVCGYIEVPWARLVSMIRVSKQDRLLIQPLPALADLWNTLALNPLSANQHGILELMKNFHDFECEDDRDRLAALMGLAFDIGPSAQLQQRFFSVNYAYDTEKNYTQFAEALCAIGRLGDVLREAVQRRSSNNNGTMPSWVPDWRNSRVNRSYSDLDQHSIATAILQASQSGRSHRLVTPIYYRRQTDVRTIPKLKSWISTRTANAINPGIQHQSDLNYSLQNGSSICPFEVTWTSSSFGRCKPENCHQGFATWIAQATSTLFAWVGQRMIEHKNRSVTWRCIFINVLLFLTQGHHIDGEKNLDFDVEDERARLDLTDKVLSGYIASDIAELAKRFEDARMIICGPTGEYSQRLEDYVLGIAPGAVCPHDKVILFSTVSISFTPHTSHEIPDYTGKLLEGHYIFREMRCIAGEKYPAVSWQGQALHANPNVVPISEKGPTSTSQPRDIRAVTDSAYVVVGLGTFSNRPWLYNRSWEHTKNMVTLERLVTGKIEGKCLARIRRDYDVDNFSFVIC